jgi:hypothetical protein
VKRGLAAVALTVTLVLAGCGGDDAAVSRRAGRALNDQLDLVEFAIAAHDYGAAREGLTQVRTAAARFAERDTISDDRLPSILQAVDDLDNALREAEAAG